MLKQIFKISLPLSVFALMSCSKDAAFFAKTGESALSGSDQKTLPIGGGNSSGGGNAPFGDDDGDNGGGGDDDNNGGNGQDGDPKNPDLGIKGGHFDVDTSYGAAKAINKRFYQGHTHEYDDKFDVTELNIVSPLDSRLLKMKSVVKEKSFYIKLINSELNQGVDLSINQKKMSSTDYADEYENAPDKRVLYSFNASGAGSESIEELSFEVKKDVLSIDNGLVKTTPRCVQYNVLGKDAKKSYRNGALVLQAIHLENKVESVIFEIMIYNHTRERGYACGSDHDRHHDHKHNEKDDDHGHHH